MFLFASCENFLKSGDIANEIKEAIEIANSNPVSIFITPDENSGTAVPNQIQAKKNQSFILTFQPSSNYEFIKWEVLNRKTREPVENAVKFEDETALETKATILKAVENLLIYPKCVLVPSVIEITPSPSGQNLVNTPIRIKFNMPMDDSIVDKVKISYFGTDMADYFEKPFLNENKDILTIRAKTPVFIPFIKSLQKGSADINISLPETICVTIDEKIYSLKQNDYSNFSFHYVTVSDYEKPEEKDFFLSKEFIESTTDISNILRLHEDIYLIDAEHDRDKFHDEQEQKVLDNLCGKYVYLYGKFYDKDSGVNSVDVFEQFCGDNLELYIAPQFLSKTYYLYEKYEGSWFYTDNDGVTTFCIKHYFKTKDGAVNISIGVNDVNGNSVKTKGINCFKLGRIRFEDVGMYNICNDIPSIYSEQGFYNSIRNIAFDIYESDAVQVPYDGYCQIPGSFYTLECEYLHSDGYLRKDTLHLTSEEYFWWAFTLDVEKVSGLKLKFIITDKIGNECIKEYDIPKSEDYVGIQTPDAEDTNKATVQFIYKTGDFACYPRPLEVVNGNTLKYGNNWSSDEYASEIEIGKSYKFIPHVGFDLENDPNVCFYSEIPDYTYMVNNNVINTGTVTLQNYEGTNQPYKIINNGIEGLLDISIKISEDSWNQGFSDIMFILNNNAFTSGQFNDDKTELYSWFDDKDDNSILFDKKSRSCESTLSAVIYSMFQNPTNLTVCGIKDGVCVSSSSVQIPQFTADNAFLNYDNVKPSVDTSLPNSITNNDITCDTVTLRFKDEESGVSTTKTYVIEGVNIIKTYGSDIKSSDLIKIDNAGLFYTNAAGLTVFADSHTDIHNGYITIPRWLYTDTGFTYYYRDRNGNTRCNFVEPNVYSQLFKISRFTKSSPQTDDSATISIALQLLDYKVVHTKRVLIYEWDSTNEKWSSTYKSKDYDTLYSATIDLSSGTHYSSKKFVKVVVDVNSGKVCNCFTHPAYVYTGKSNSGDYDYLYPPFNNNLSIASDAPVLVRTVVTSASYDECKNWSAAEWEDGKHCIKEEVLDFSSTKTSPKVYHMYNDDPDDPSVNWLKNKCYAAVVHFADGSRAVSQVLQK